MDKMLLVCIMIMVLLASAYENVKVTINPNIFSESKPAMDESVISNNRSEYCEMESINLDSDTEKYVYGTWKVEKHLGFANSYNDASEYPAGQKFIGDEMIIHKAFFSSKGLKNYSVYQYELTNPLYKITTACYNSDSFYRLYKIDIPDLKLNDVLKVIHISDPSTKQSIPLSFFVINNDRLILLSEATIFELKKLTD